jgi:hypothetical protein
MNIFLLHLDPTKCAQYHADKHVVKMILETAQMLCAVHWRYGSPAPYKATHKNHPCTVWAGNTTTNYHFLHDLGIALCNEYTYRYNKTHKTENILNTICTPPSELLATGLTDFVQAMPEEYKGTNAVEAYRTYYQQEKAYLCQWKNRPVPPFMQQAMLSVCETT